MRVEAFDVHATVRGQSVLAGASLLLDSKQGHGLVGDNGSGKSTLLRVLAGCPPPELKISGELQIDGTEVLRFHDPEVANATGIYYLPQEPPVFADLTVLENLFVGHECPGALGTIDQPAAACVARATLDELGWTLDLAAMGTDLPASARHQVGILRVLLRRPRPGLLLLDEPTARLSKQDRRALLELLKQLIRDGVGVLLVSHRLADALDVCHSISVMQSGRVTGTYPTGSEPTVWTRRLDLALPAAREAPARRASSDQILDVSIASLTWATVEEPLTDVCFMVHPGDVFGIHSERPGALETLFDALIGPVEPPIGFRGRIVFMGEDITSADTGQRRRRGIAFVPANKLQRGIAPDLSVHENLVLDCPGRSPWLWDRRTESIAVDRATRMHIHHARLRDEARHLSGGFQQRTVLAREFGASARLLVLHNPAQSLDAQTARETLERTRRIADDGLAVILLSSDEDEIASVATRSIEI